MNSFLFFTKAGAFISHISLAIPQTSHASDTVFLLPHFPRVVFDSRYFEIKDSKVLLQIAIFKCVYEVCRFME